MFQNTSKNNNFREVGKFIIIVRQFNLIILRLLFVLFNKDSRQQFLVRSKNVNIMNQ